MEKSFSQTYYVIKPTTHQKKKLVLGLPVSLTESQARPLRHGGFITLDKHACTRVEALTKEVAALKDELAVLKTAGKNTDDTNADIVSNDEKSKSIEKNENNEKGE